MKAIVILDEMPGTCEKCGERYKAYFKHEGWIQMCGRMPIKRLEDDWEDRRASWCPLRPLPERKDDGEIVCYVDGEPMTEKLADRLMDFGFNECLYAITGGEE